LLLLLLLLQFRRPLHAARAGKRLEDLNLK